MKRNRPDPGSILERAVSEIRRAPVADNEEEAMSRVKSRLQAEADKIIPHPAMAQPGRIGGCEDFQSLIPAYLSSSLNPSRKLLFDDHMSECSTCWKAFERHTTKPARRRLAGNSARRQWWKPVAAIAACALAIAALTQTGIVRNIMWPIDASAIVQTVEGNLYGVAGQNVRQVAVGQRVQDGQSLRTGPGSGAVLELADGSRIEMNERSELALDRGGDGVRVELRRGNVIVTAAKQHGHLYVATSDCTVSVVGTVFSVSAGAKGSRVSVVEGEVHVQYGETSEAIRPGQQITTNPALPRVAVRDEIGWSRDLGRHLALLNAFVTASQSLSQSFAIAGLRYTSSLVPVAPEDTVLFASFPNVPESIPQLYEMLKARISENGMLDRWWQSNRSGLDEMVASAARVSAYLGPEIVIAVPRNARSSAPVLLANAVRPDDLAVVLRDDAAAAGSSVLAHVSGGLMVMSSSAAQIQRTLAYQAQFGSNPFQSTALYRRLAQAYTEGVGWLLAADLEKIAGLQNAEEAAESQTLGLINLQQLIVEQKTGSNGPAYLATLGFKEARTGMASWLGAPSTMGALDLVSPNAYSVAGVITKDPNLILDDIFALLQNDSEGSAGALQRLEEFQQQNHVDLRRDVAAALGNEFLFAIDGPLLPSPSWKVIIEVTDAAHLQNALQWSFSELNRQAAVDHKPGIALTSEASGGMTFYTVTSSEFPSEIHYTFWGGYLILAPNRQLLVEAMRYWITHNSLARSQDFRMQLPADGRGDFSGVVYFNVKGLANAVPGGALKNVNIPFPTLVCLYGQPDRILMSSKGVLGTNIMSAESLGTMMDAIRRR